MRIRELTLSLTLLIPLTGCLETAVGAGAIGAGYIANNEITRTAEKRRAKVEREERRKYEERLRKEREIFESKLPSGDERARNALTASLLGGKLTHVLSINPEVQNGVITLYGVVPSPVIADRAVAAAREIPGIRGVNSQLMINERRIEPILGSDGKPVRPPYAHRPNQGVQQQPEVMRPVRPNMPPLNRPSGTGGTPPPPQLAPPPARQFAPPPPRIVPQRPMVPPGQTQGRPEPAENLGGGAASGSGNASGFVITPPPPSSMQQNGRRQAPRGMAPTPAPVPPPPNAATNRMATPPPSGRTAPPNRFISGTPPPNFPPPTAPPRSEVTVTPSQPGRDVSDRARLQGLKLKQLERPPIGSGRDHWYPKYIQEGD